MPDRKPEEQLSERDRLITRPDEPLPTPLEPDSPEARGAPADPKPDRRRSQGQPAGTTGTNDPERTT